MQLGTFIYHFTTFRQLYILRTENFNEALANALESDTDMIVANACTITLIETWPNEEIPNRLTILLYLNSYCVNVCGRLANLVCCILQTRVTVEDLQVCKKMSLAQAQIAECANALCIETTVNLKLATGVCSKDLKTNMPK